MRKVPDKLLELKNDLVFQELFGKQKNSKITSHFLSLILEREIKDIDLDANKRMLGNRINAKTGRLDIRAKFNDGEDCNIELQVIEYENMPERMLDYWGVMYSNKINRGQGYDVLKPSISILIADYKLSQTKEIEKYHTIWNLREKENTNIILTKNIEMHVLEIPKIKEKEVEKEELAQWLKMIENPENKEVEKFMVENKYWKQAREELAYLSGDEDFQRLVEARAGFLMDQECYKRQSIRQGLKQGLEQGLEQGKKQGLEQGLKQGKIEEKKEIAKKLLKLKMPIKQIAEITELDFQELERLSKEIN